MSLENLKSATREKIYQHLREIFEEMDIVEALDSLEHRLYALRDRASRNLKTEPLKEEAKAESKTVLLLFLLIAILAMPLSSIELKKDLSGVLATI